MEGIDAGAGHGLGDGVGVGGVVWWWWCGVVLVLLLLLLLSVLLLGRVSRLFVLEGADDSSGFEGWAGGSGEGAARAACAWWLYGVCVWGGAVVGGGVRGVNGNVRGLPGARNGRGDTRSWGKRAHESHPNKAGKDTTWCTKTRMVLGCCITKGQDERAMVEV